MIRYLRYLKNKIMDKPKQLPIISIVGTTGVGKSQFSIDLAKAINGEIINADSMQVYKSLPQITNKHPIEEREGVPHHVMDHVKWDENYYIHRFEMEAKKAIEDIHSRNKIPIIIGGTHYYLNTLIFDNKTIGEKKEERELTREELEVLDGPVENLFQVLSSIDPLIASKFHPQDQRKLRRALEIYYTTGEKPSFLYQEQKLDELEKSSLKYNTLIYWIYCESDILKPRLDKRVDKMFESGALEEIKELYTHYTGQDCTHGIFQVIGFKEFLPWLEKQDHEKLFLDCVDRMKIRTRQYAKYQNKWIRKLLIPELKKEERFNWINGGKIYLLNASNLDNWNENVKDRGIEIAEKFLKREEIDTEQSPSPELSYLINESETNNRAVDSHLNWKHYTCDICKDKSNNSFVAVGEENWILHQQSKRHKRNVNYEKITEEREMYKKLKQEKRQKLEETKDENQQKNVEEKPQNAGETDKQEELKS
ncbi:unnamed protein product [Candida verbasci]|uniref:tRNA dimethylallyltransferase n=1 Tax=Candida verbasci TaxID=1227364 RepID=A0A9W4X9H0_9ASCO|nr:unnamed protein product [Candida verbasci]